MTFRSKKAKKRSMTPEYLAKQEEQDDELNRELQKTVTLGQDIVKDFEGLLNSGDMNDRIDEGI